MASDDILYPYTNPAPADYTPRQLGAAILRGGLPKPASFRLFAGNLTIAFRETIDAGQQVTLTGILSAHAEKRDDSIRMATVDARCVRRIADGTFTYGGRSFSTCEEEQIRLALLLGATSLTYPMQVMTHDDSEGVSIPDAPTFIGYVDALAAAVQQRLHQAALAKTAILAAPDEDAADAVVIAYLGA